MLEALGVRVVKMRALGADGAFVRRYGVLLVDADLTADQREIVTCRTLGAVAQGLGHAC